MSNTFSPPPPLPVTSLSNLDPQRFESAQRLFQAIFYSKRSESIFAQVIDGKLTASVWKENTGFLPEIPEIQERFQPTESSVKRFREIRAEVQFANLFIPSKVAQAFQISLLDSHEFRLRLLEVIAVVFHTLGGTTFRTFHPETQLFPLHTTGPGIHYYIDLFHRNYMLFHQYPYGLLNLIGYWVETQIFGGVILFDKNQLDNEKAFVHTQLRGMFQLTNSQLDEFTHLLPSEADNYCEHLLLPFKPDSEAPQIQMDKIWNRDIFRDDFSRMIRPNVSSHRCVRPITEVEKGWVKWLEEHPQPELSAEVIG